jgi:hypothetical protein
MLRIICQELHSKVNTSSVPMVHMENPHPQTQGKFKNQILRCGIVVLRVTRPSRFWKGGGLEVWTF